MAQTFVVGDIHGALKALQQVITVIDFRKDDLLIFLGDYVDGWSESPGVITYLDELGTICNCIFLRGNHDVWCESWLKGEYPNPYWLQHGGKSTVEAYRNIGVHEKQRHLAFFSRMQNYYIDDKNRLFVHAGFSSMHGPETESYESNFYWDRTLWEVAVTIMDSRIQEDSVWYPKRLKLFEEIFIGHTPTINFNSYMPMHAANVWNVDTGAAFTGRLSVINAETKKVWQSDIVQQLYPGEKGRNKD
ncbi:serine/threonine protein phosphatase [Terrimonas sp.]|uniref:metallophosphoesterase family protein n=1 Tax=Terrimonas sp. TaxID=1914338 RepID=UPI000D520F3C|nr:metallophosphoesterase family protein [Terrimonas sp.]PVD52469.1 serine/threonine protein phosphatase [Terrimonas sp.]